MKMHKKILIILSILLLAIGILLLSKDYFKPKNNFQGENKTSYEVTLNPNTYFSNTKISENNYYIANAIKSIDIYFNYYLKNVFEENYSYDITTYLKSYADNGTKLIWSKDFNSDSFQNIKQKKLIINKVYNIDYQYYVNYVKSFQEYYNIKTESYLYIKLNIKVNNTDNNYILFTIPLNENIIEITKKEDNSFLNANLNNDFNKKGAYILIIIAIIILVIQNNFNHDNEYKLLKNYQDIIIKTTNKPFINSNKIISLTNLKDLINIAINYNINIFNYYHIYYLIKDNTYYIYNLKEIKKA